MKLRFRKMHGCGNDFVVIDARPGSHADWSQAAPRLLDRRFGVGADQLLILLPSNDADVRMRVFERDGAESEMCGNGIRCVAKLLKEEKPARKRFTVDTLGGRKVLEIGSDGRISVEMGAPILDSKLWGRDVKVAGRSLKLHPLSMGNPHAVIFVGADELEEIGQLGPAVERHPLFPKRTNVELVCVRNRHELDVRVWERGAGETYACGTGASASAVAAITEGVAESPVTVHFQGGDLEIAWKPGMPVVKTGPAVEVFEGEVEL